MARTGRPREFDVEEALVKARDVFWAKGYAATSIQDLVDDLAVQRASLIDTSLTMVSDGARGCLVGNTAAELAPSDEEVRELLVSAHAGTVRVLTAALTRAQATGEVTSTAAPEMQARMLLLPFQGYAVVTRAGVDPETLVGGLDAAIEGLRA